MGRPMELLIWLIEEVTEYQALEVMQSIIEHTTWNFNTLFRNGYNALHFACEAGQPNLVEYLLLQGKCKPDTKMNTGYTPLELCSNLTVSKILYSKGPFLWTS